MDEEYSSSEQFYQRPTNWQNVNNVIERDPNARAIDVIQISDQRQNEHARLTQKSLPSLKQSYGSIYNSSPYMSETDPLIASNYYQKCQPYLCAEPIRLTRYRRTQIFLFFYIVFYVGYLIIGSICFQKLENGIEQQVRDEFREDRQKFLQDYPNVKG